MQAYDIWGRLIPNHLAERVIVSTTDILLQYLEKIKGATDIKIDWGVIGSEAVKDCQNYDTVVRFKTLCNQSIQRSLNTDSELEEMAYRWFVLDLVTRLHQIGFYKLNPNFHYVFEQFIGEDMLLKCLVQFPAPIPIQPPPVPAQTVMDDRMRIAHFLEGH